jgi:peptide/nickel transport system permease protein
MSVAIPTDPVLAEPEPDQPGSSQEQRVTGRYGRALRSPAGITGIALILFVTVASLVGSIFLKYGPNEQGPDALVAPGLDHLLGTDQIGRDLLARLIAGTQVDLIVTLVAVPIAAIVGTLLGLIGVVSPRLGSFFQRVFEVFLGVPAIILGVGIAIAITPGQTSVTIAIILVITPLFGRQARSALLGQLSLDYVAAAEVLGYSRTRLMMRHILPNIVDGMFVRFAMEMARAITIEGSLSVIGLGIQSPQSSLGLMIKDGSGYLLDYPLYAMAPVIVVVVLVFGYTTLANALNRAVLRT